MYIKYFFLSFILIFSAHAMEESPDTEKQSKKRQRPSDQIPQSNRRKFDEEGFLASLPRTPVVTYYCRCLSNPELPPTNKAMIFSNLGDHLEKQGLPFKALQSYIHAINIKNADGTDALDGDTRTITLSSYAKLNKIYQIVRMQSQMIQKQRGHQRR